MELNPTQKRIMTLLEFGDTSIDEIWAYCRPAMPQTVNRELRELENDFNLITPTKFGKHNAKLAYKKI